MSRPFLFKYDWDDFDNTSLLTSYQKHRIKKLCENVVCDVIQETINQSNEDRIKRRVELAAHIDIENPFLLDIGGEG
jgi:hypothetical protein|tara:strand:- start:837 stop:1067 length:231 start_codon:yes stop_codon:yes gene_type:complete